MPKRPKVVAARLQVTEAGGVKLHLGVVSTRVIRLRLDAFSTFIHSCTLCLATTAGYSAGNGLYSCRWADSGELYGDVAPDGLTTTMPASGDDVVNAAAAAATGRAPTSGNAAPTKSSRGKAPVGTTRLATVEGSQVSCSQAPDRTSTTVGNAPSTFVCGVRSPKCYMYCTFAYALQRGL